MKASNVRNLRTVVAVNGLVVSAYSQRILAETSGCNGGRAAMQYVSGSRITAWCVTDSNVGPRAKHRSGSGGGGNNNRHLSATAGASSFWRASCVLAHGHGRQQQHRQEAANKHHRESEPHTQHHRRRPGADRRIPRRRRTVHSRGLKQLK